ncbi:MAG: hypothetical protein J7576_02655 [Siphonobacter aquaeclarae]|nr:hypothetical protein [Siphonobacter aquaeclarae]
MKDYSLKEILLLSAAVGFLMIWVGEIIAGQVSWKESYFWVMFSVGCLMAFQYVKNQRLQKEQANKPAPPRNPRKK